MEKNFKSPEFWEKLGVIRNEVLASVESLLKELGGKVCMLYYHIEKSLPRYTFFEVDSDGHGFELFIDSIEEKNDYVAINFSDGEDYHESTSVLSCLNLTEAMYVLEELENVKNYVDKNCEEVVTDFNI